MAKLVEIFHLSVCDILDMFSSWKARGEQRHTQEELQRQGQSSPDTNFLEQSSLLVIIEVLKLLFLIMITPVLVWRVPDDRIEKPNLAEEDGD